jgi:integrase
MVHRWPRSLHSQVEAVLQGIRSFRQGKTNSDGIRSFGGWKVYRYEAHRFVEYMQDKGRKNLLDSNAVTEDMVAYLTQKLEYYVANNRSRQTMETLLSALGKLEYAINFYIEHHGLGVTPLNIEKIRMDFYSLSKSQLPKSSKVFGNRAYPDPVRLIESIANPTFQLQASLQYEGGLRAEGVGAPSNRRLKNSLAAKGLRGIAKDPVTGKLVGVVAATEKGGKETDHYVSLETYSRLEAYILIHHQLESDYGDYVNAINQAAKETGQYARGRGSHGLKHNFAQERYLECVSHGFSHEQALQQTSLETSHFRMRETLTYTSG